jgi:hypothetical protein
MDRQKQIKMAKLTGAFLQLLVANIPKNEVYIFELIFFSNKLDCDLLDYSKLK